MNYNHNNETTNNDLLHKLEDYMLTQETMNKSLQYIKNTERLPNIEKKEFKVSGKSNNNNNNNNNNVVKKSYENNFFIPKEKDTLFWCYYIIKHGFAKYEYPGSTSFVNEKEEKFSLIESLRLKKQILKINKIKNIKEDVEDELANKEQIGMKTFIALCVAENINILFIHKRKCFQLLSSSEEQPIYHVIHKYDKPERYCYELNTTQEQWTKYKTEYFHWESLEKPLKAISAYKVDELMDICKQLGIPMDSKKTKKELYELILTTV